MSPEISIVGLCIALGVYSLIVTAVAGYAMGYADGNTQTVELLEYLIEGKDREEDGEKNREDRVRAEAAAAPGSEGHDI